MTAERRRAWPAILDAAIALVIFAISTMVGAGYLAHHRTNAIGDFLEQGSMVACGYGLSVPAQPQSDAFRSFLLRERETISCADAVGTQPPKPAGGFAANHRNLIYSVAAAIKIGGLSWPALDVAVGMVFGLSMALIYGLLRLAVWRGLAIAGVAMVLCSNHVAQLINLRDFFKEPWFLGAWLAIGWLLARKGDRATARLYLPAAVAGLVVGLGLGFRVDLLACAPIVPLVIALVVKGWDRPSLVIKGMAIASFIGTLGITGLPTLLSLTGGSNSPHVTILGFMRPFAVELGLEPPLYDIGDIYADGYARSLIAAHAVVVQHDPNETLTGTPEYDRQGLAVVTENLAAFPADHLIRVVGAVRQIVKYPFTKLAREAHLAGDLFQPGWLYNLAQARAAAFAWIDGRAVALAIAALALLFVRDWRVGASVTLMVLYFCGYSMIQFSRRHTFHFDVIPIAFLMIAVQGACLGIAGVFRSAPPGYPSWSILARRATVGLLCAGALAASLASIVWIARVWQQSHVTEVFDRTLQIRWDSLPTTREPLSLVHEGAIEPTWYDLDLVHGGKWRLPLEFVRVSLPEPPSADPTRPNRWAYLRLDVGGPGCAATSVPVALRYSAVARTFDWEYTRVFEVPVDRGAAPSTILTPVLYRIGSSAFEGFLVPAELGSCVGAAYRAASDAIVPMPIVAAVLPPDWKHLPLYQRLAR